MRRILIAVVVMATASPAFAELMGPSTNISFGTPSQNRSLFINPHSDRERYHYPGVNDPQRTPTGDTYDVAPLTQSTTAAYYMTPGRAVNVTFDGTPDPVGANLANSGSSFSAKEMYQPGAGPNGGDLIGVEVASMGAAGGISEWEVAGFTGPAPNNETLVEWRLDVGITNAGGTDSIIGVPSNPFSVLSTEMEAFDLDGDSLGMFPMSVDLSDANGLSGVALLNAGGGDIAGFGLGSIRLTWEIQEVPEPAAATLLGLAGLALIRLRRRR